MAVVSGISQSGEQVLYDIPDCELEKYKLPTAPMTDADIAQLFPGKEGLTREDAHGFVQVGADASGDVTAYQPVCVYWYYDTFGVYHWWYDWC
jgi:hypothetical protein